MSPALVLLSLAIGALAFDWAFQFQIKLIYSVVTTGARPTGHKFGPPLKLALLYVSVALLALALVYGASSPLMWLFYGLTSLAYLSYAAAVAVKSMKPSLPRGDGEA